MLVKEFISVKKRKAAGVAVNTVKIAAVFAVHPVKSGVEESEDTGRAFLFLMVHAGIIQISFICVQIADAVMMKFFNAGTVSGIHAVKTVVIVVVGKVNNSVVFAEQSADHKIG